MRRLRGTARLGQFIARGDKRDARAAGNLDPSDVGPGQRDHRPWMEALPFFQQHVPGRKIAGFCADMTRRAEAFPKADLVPVTFGIFLHHDAIGARGQVRAGEDAHGFTRVQLPCKRRTRRRFADHGQAALARSVGDPDGIPVHRRDIRAGGIERRRYVLREHTPRGLRNRHSLAREGLYCTEDG